MSWINHHQCDDQSALNRRGFFSRMADGLQGAALTYLAGQTAGGSRLRASQNEPAETQARTTHDLRSRPAHFPPKAKSVIQIFMQGGPSHVDLFDPKPMLDKYHGKDILDQLATVIEFLAEAGAVMRSPFKFAQHGESGIWLSNIMPHLAKQVDKIAVIRSMFTTTVAHEPGIFKLQSGQLFSGSPSMGSWVVYGLGSENQNLPAFVALANPRSMPVVGVQNWQAGYLPPLYQGTRFRSTGSPVLNLKPQFQQPTEVFQIQRDLLQRLDQIHKRQRQGHLQLDARIASYELAARMQLNASAALDLSRETSATLQMYGVGQQPTDGYARRCLMARRLVERGVRFVQVNTDQQLWDHHHNIASELSKACKLTDQPVAALLQDLQQRGLLESTLVIWCGEFGRLPIAQIPDDKDAKHSVGRDHNGAGFSLWMAGAGVKGGTVHGATDELGFRAVENRVSIADWHATILHLLGLHHQGLFFPRNGLNEKLTGVEKPHIVREILA